MLVLVETGLKAGIERCAVVVAEQRELPEDTCPFDT